VFVKVAADTGESELVELVSNQQIITRVLLPYLKRIDFDADSLLACRWNIVDGIVVDPARRYGKPIVTSVAIPTAILYAAFRNNGNDFDRVAEWYGVGPDDVKTAVDFEQSRSRDAA
jgi:uncharacterized protein (DUF433 family)